MQIKNTMTKDRKYNKFRLIKKPESLSPQAAFIYLKQPVQASSRKGQSSRIVPAISAPGVLLRVEQLLIFRPGLVFLVSKRVLCAHWAGDSPG